MADLPPAYGPIPLTQAQISDIFFNQNGYYLLPGQFTYSLAVEGSDFPGIFDPPVKPFTPAQAAIFETALTRFDSYIAPDFRETDDGAEPGFIRAGLYTTGPRNSTRLPQTYPGTSAQEVQPDLVGNILFSDAAGPDRFNILSPIGVTLGLSNASFLYAEGRDLAPFGPSLDGQALIDFGRNGTQFVNPILVYLPPLTPSVVEVAALQNRYGADPDTAPGDDVYRFADGAILRETIYDAGGIDTIDVSALSRPSVIDLRPGAYSSIGYQPLDVYQADITNRIGQGYANDIAQYFNQYRDIIYTGRNNVGIAFSTTIENAVGSIRDDRIIGSDAANRIDGGGGADSITGGLGADILLGGAGTDQFRDTGLGFDGDRIEDFAFGDTVAVTDATIETFAYVRGGETLTFPGASLTLAGLTGGRLALSAMADGGVALSLLRDGSGLNDFDRDGHADILFANRGLNAISSWEASGNVTATLQQNSMIAGGPDPVWRAQGLLDATGDGVADLLWRNGIDGALAVWQARGDGSFAPGGYVGPAVDASWTVTATGDFTGDGREDVLWRNSSGAIDLWRSTGSGFAIDPVIQVARSWHVQGAGDFNGDGRSDLLWRNDNGSLSIWTANDTNGGFLQNTYFRVPLALDQHVAAIGDATGDGLADILFRRDNGELSLWSRTASGFVENAYSDTSVPTDWKIAGLYDFNDDGRDDILWRNDNGSVSVWQAAGAGFAQSVYNGFADPGWSIVTVQHDLV